MAAIGEAALRVGASPPPGRTADTADGRGAARAAEARSREEKRAEGAEEYHLKEEGVRRGDPKARGPGVFGGGGAAGEASAEDEARARARAGESFVVSDRLSDLAGDVAALGMDARGRKPSGKARRGRR